MSISTSKMILSALSRDNAFSSKVFPHLKADYFSSSERILYEIINNFISKYSSLPSKEAILIELENKQNIKQSVLNESLETVEELYSYELKEGEWLVDTAEKYCQDMALQLALIESVAIADKMAEGKGSGISQTMIPDMLAKALAVSFKSKLGLDYLEEPEERYTRYCVVEDKVPFDIDIFNTITNGGFSKGTENIFLAGTAGGKTLTMCSFAAGQLLAGKNVLYITLEIDELNASKRIDANLMDIDINHITSIGSESYISNIENIRKKTLGNFIFHEDLSGNFNTIKMKSLLENLKLKKNFVPDIVYVDYLTLCTSSIYKQGTTTSFVYYKSVAEELRLLCKQLHFALVTCVQLNRGAYEDSDAGLTGISESWGIASTGDWVSVIIQTEELKSMMQYDYKQLKSRYTDLSENVRFAVGVDKRKMRLYSLDDYTAYTRPSVRTIDVSQDDTSSKIQSLRSKYGLDDLTL